MSRPLFLAAAVVASLAAIHPAARPAAPRPAAPAAESAPVVVTRVPAPPSPVPAAASPSARARVAAAPRVVVRKPAAVSAPARPVLGGDVSWPNCPRTMGIPGRHGYDLPMPVRSARYVVLGATNGPAHTRNPCLASQARWAKARHLPMAAYAVIHFPTRAELVLRGGRGSTATRLHRVGAAQVRHALATLRRAHVPTPIVWVDVETVGGHPWSRSVAANRALLSGVLAEYKRLHVRTGIYSYKTAWNRIMGGWRLRSVPTWVPAGATSRAAAMRKCAKPSFSAGPVLMTQWTDGRRDYDITCPGVRTTGLFRKA